MKKHNGDDAYLNENITKDLDELEQFLCYIGLKDELMNSMLSYSIISLNKLLYLDENLLQKISQLINDNQKKLLIKNINLLKLEIENNKENNKLDISNFTFDLGGNPITKETVINGFKLKTKTQQILSYQQNLEKNSKPENIFVSFLSNKNLSKISNFEIFKNLKHLYLSENKLQKINNLENLINLNILDLGNNFIRKIENLDNLVNLQTLNLEHNLIDKLENLSLNSNLITLNLSNQVLPINKVFIIDENTLPFNNILQNLLLENIQICDTRGLKIFRSIQILKLKNNKIDELNYVLEAIKEMPLLENLNILNNNLKESMKNCRDIIIVYGQNLKEFNEKNVTSNERSFLNSFYSRKSSLKPKQKIKKESLILDIIKIDTKQKEMFPPKKNFQYYNYK